MSLIVASGRPGFRWSYHTAATPGSSGTSVIPGTGNVEGNWTQVASAASITDDVYGIAFRIIAGNTSGQSKMHLLDIGIDPAGGSSYTEVVPNLQCGSSGGAAATGGIWFYVPIFIPAGASVAVRIQGNNATAGTVGVIASFFGRPIRPEFCQKLQCAETIGTITASRGVAITPGANNAEGNWALIGTTTYRWKYILPLLQIDDSSTSGQGVHLDVAHGDGTTFDIVSEGLTWFLPGTAEVMFGGPYNVENLWCDIPSGASIYVRLSTSLATADSNYAVLVTGLG